MSLYSDLSEVLTPYANKIKELNGSLLSERAKKELLYLLGTLAFGNENAKNDYDRLAFFINNPTATLYPIYTLESATTFTGDSSEQIDTGIRPLSKDNDYAVVCTFTTNNDFANNTNVFSCLDTGRNGLKYQIVSSAYSLVSNGASIGTPVVNPSNTYTVKIIIRHEKGNPLNRVTVHRNHKWNDNDQNRKDYTVGTSIPEIVTKLTIGGGGFKGTISDFKWYIGEMSDSEVTAYIGE